MPFVQILGKLHSITQRAARVRGHQVRNRILFLAEPLVYFVKLSKKFFVYAVFRLAHTTQDVIRDMLGGNAELTAYVVAAKLVEKAVVFIREKIVKPYSGADKDLFDLWQSAELSQKLQIVAVRHLHVFARSGKKALPAPAYALFKLFLTGRGAEVGGRTSYIVNIAFEIGHFGHALCFAEY